LSQKAHLFNAGGIGMNEAALWEWGGYLGLVVMAFVGVLPTPFSYKPLLILMPLGGWPPLGVFMAATVGAMAGMVVNYQIGQGGSVALRRWLGGGKWWTMAAEGTGANGPRFLRARAWLRRWHAPLLMACWVPYAGDPFITVAAGAEGLDWWAFLGWTLLGRCAFHGVMIGAALWWA
jgi:membrane protein YqaA with SNARE-associated domain